VEKTGTDLCRPMINKLGRHAVKLSLAAACVLGLSACAANEGISSLGTTDCKMISDRAEAKINWARVPEIELVVRDGAFTPMVTRMRQGRPYVLRIRNRDDEMRVFRAGDFFQKNAVIAIGVEGERAPETCVTAVSIPSRQAAEIRMVAITDGTYDYEDNYILLPWVVSSGPNGVIIVEERRETAGLN